MWSALTSYWSPSPSDVVAPNTAEKNEGGDNNAVVEKKEDEMAKSKIQVPTYEYNPHDLIDAVMDAPNANTPSRLPGIVAGHACGTFTYGNGGIRPYVRDIPEVTLGNIMCMSAQAELQRASVPHETRLRRRLDDEKEFQREYDKTAETRDDYAYLHIYKPDIKQFLKEAGDVSKNNVKGVYTKTVLAALKKTITDDPECKVIYITVYNGVVECTTSGVNQAAIEKDMSVTMNAREHDDQMQLVMGTGMQIVQFVDINLSEYASDIMSDLQFTTTKSLNMFEWQTKYTSMNSDILQNIFDVIGAYVLKLKTDNEDAYEDVSERWEATKTLCSRLVAQMSNTPKICAAKSEEPEKEKKE